MIHSKSCLWKPGGAFLLFSLIASVTELGAGGIGGMTLAPGAYKWGTGLQIRRT